jgi:CheY-like chemotaxis protein
LIFEKDAKEFLYVSNGIEAIETCKNNPDIDLILMDIDMPKMNGYEATLKIREFNSDVIIIAQTAFAIDGDRENSILAGCNEYISKPIGRIALRKLVNSYF